jgi:hypothetical protein
VPDVKSNHCEIICHVALGMIWEARAVLDPITNKPLQARSLKCQIEIYKLRCSGSNRHSLRPNRSRRCRCKNASLLSVRRHRQYCFTYGKPFTTWSNPLQSESIRVSLFSKQYHGYCVKITLKGRVKRSSRHYG